MKRALILAALAGVLSGQTILTVTGPATVHPGDTAALGVSIAGTGATGLTGVQWTFTLPTGATLANTAAISATGPNSNNGLGVFCGYPLTTICLIIGDNGQSVAINPIADGALGTIPMVVGHAMGAGNYVIPIANLIGSDATALHALPLQIGALYTLHVLSLCDINSDGVVNVADVQMMINQALGLATCSLAGGCTVVQVQAVIITALGHACVL